MEIDVLWRSIARRKRFSSRFFRGNELTSSSVTSSYAPPVNVAFEIENLSEAQIRSERPEEPETLEEDMEKSAIRRESPADSETNMASLTVSGTEKELKTVM